MGFKIIKHFYLSFSIFLKAIFPLQELVNWRTEEHIWVCKTKRTYMYFLIYNSESMSMENY